MKALQVLIAACVLSLACTIHISAENNGKSPEPEKEYRWEEVARKRHFSEKDIAHFGKHKVLITNEAFKQVFDPYIESGIPFFITSDSLLNAYHVLYEESILKLETANARKLPEILRFIWKNLQTADKDIKGNEKLAAAAKTRAQVIIGTALKLLGDESIKPDKEIAALIEGEVKRVVEAKETMLMPAWLGKPDRTFIGLDYNRFKPRGFYARSERLQRYFRAISWLQAIPFRVDRDEELLAALLLGNCLTYGRFDDCPEKRQEYWWFFHCFSMFIGDGDDWDILKLARNWSTNLKLSLHRDKLAGVRKNILGTIKDSPQINDQLRFPPAGRFRASEPNFRIISAYRTPDAILFHRTTDLRDASRSWPSGLDVCAALGSSYARNILTAEDKKKLLAQIDECKPLFKRASLYSEYLHCLKALLDEPEPDAPKFLSGEPWKIKSCQTALAGWAQMRHTWALQAKQTVRYSGGKEGMLPSFIEPDPEFFARMGALVKKTESILKKAGAFETDVESLAEDLRWLAKLIKEKGLATKGWEAVEKLSDSEEARIIELSGMRIDWLSGDNNEVKEFFKKLMKDSLQEADEIEKGEISPDLERYIKARQVDIEPLWRKLAGLCAKLEALAHKQLRGIPFNESEQRFLKHYGQNIAGIMLYGGNSYLSPNDDSPRIADVFSNDTGEEFLQVGVSRPRAIYVLYPTEKGEILCRGAVMPYYEFRHPHRLTDAEWKKLLDSTDRPKAPEWIKPILAEKGVGKAKPND